MFKISITEIGREQEEEIIIRCHEVNDEVLSIVQRLKKNENIILGNSGSEVFRISVKDIFYIESVDNKTFIYCQNQVFDTKARLYELEEKLTGTKMFRCSKAMILNLAKVRSVAPSLSGRFEARLTNGESVIISRQYVPDLKKRLGM